MPFYKDNQKAILYKDNYEPANAYGPGGSYAVKYENILNPVAASYGSANERFEALGDGSFKVTRLSATTAGWHYGMNFNKTYELKASHKYYFQIDCYVNRLPSSTTQLCTEDYFNGQWMSPQLPTAANEWQTIYKFGTGWSSWDPSQLRNRILLWHVMTDSQGFEDGDYYMVRRPIFIDLTDAFGSGYEPTTQQELYAALPQLANGGYMPPTKATTLEHTYIPTKVPTAYWIGENCNVHWNQLFNQSLYGSDNTLNGITYTKGVDGSVTLNGTVTDAVSYWLLQSSSSTAIKAGHKYYFTSFVPNMKIYLRYWHYDGTVCEPSDVAIWTAPKDGWDGHGVYLRVGPIGQVYDNVKIHPMLFDLTEMFGAGYEPTIDEFKAMYPNDYYPYDESYSPYTSVGNRITAYKGNNYVNFRNQAITVAATTKYGVTITKNADGSMNIHGTCTETPAYHQFDIATTVIRRDGSKYLYRFNKGITVTDPQTTIDGKFGVDGYGPKDWGSFIFSVVADGTWGGFVHIYLTAGTTIDVDNLFVEVFNLTDMFGKGKEPTIEQFNLLFPNTYYPYTASTYIRDVKGYDTQLTLPGGPLYFNQLIADDKQHQSITITKSAGSWAPSQFGLVSAIKGHKYYIANNLSTNLLCMGLIATDYTTIIAQATTTANPCIAEAVVSRNGLPWLYRNADGTFADTCLTIIDLTAMYGYGNEPSTVEEFKTKYPNDCYPYTTSKLIPAQVRKDLYRVNFNQIVRSFQSGESTKCGITLTRTVTDQYITFTATGTATAWSGDPNWYINSYNNLIAGHKYYVRANGGNLVSMYMYTGWTTHPCVNALGTIVTASDTGRVNESVTVRFAEYAPEGTVVNETFTVEIIDLTQTFGAGYEPDNVYILNELFGHTFLPYTTSMWVDSPNNIITETPSQITKMLAGYRTVQKQGYEISVDGTYNDPFVCTYYPEQSTQLTSTGANKVDLVNHAGEDGLQIMPDGRFKWTQSPTSGGRFLGFFTNPDGSYVSLAAGQTLTTSCIVDDIVLSGEVNYICGLIYYNNDGTYSYIGAISSDTSLIGQWQSKSYTTQKAVDKIRLYFTNASGTQPTDYIIFKDFQLEIDTNVGQYEPYTSQLPAPTPTNMLPISYNKSQKIVLDTDDTHSTYNFPITSDAKLIWKPSDYSTDLTVTAFMENTRMKKRVGTDYVQLVPLITSGDTALQFMPTNRIQLEANKTYAMVFRFKKVNCALASMSASTSSSFTCNITDSSGNITAAKETVFLKRGNNYEDIYDEGWAWARYTAPTTDNYYVRVGVDVPNALKVFEDRGSYIQFTDIALYEGTLIQSNKPIGELQAVLSDGNKQTIVSNKELGIANRSSWYVDSLEPYVKDTNNEWKSKLNQNTGVIVYKGDENWELSSGKLHTFKCGSHNFITDGGFCTHFPLMTSPSDIDVRTSVYLLWSSPVIITKMDCDSVADFKAFLAAEYNKGTPVTILTARGTNKLTTYNNPLLAHTLPYHTDINTDAEYLTVSVKESI